MLCALTSAALAQGSPAQEVEPKGYRAAIDEALSEYQALNFEEARALFAKAHALFPNARTLRGLGMVEFERRNYRASADYLTQALASQVRPLEGELRTATEQLLERARGFLGEIRLSVEPTDARVLLDGEPIARRRRHADCGAGRRPSARGPRRRLPNETAHPGRSGR